MTISIEKPVERSLSLDWRSLKQNGWLVRSVSVLITLALWEWYGRGVDPIFLSYPTAILAAVPKMLATGELQSAFLVSLQGLLIGLALSISSGVLIGLLTGRYRFIDYLLDVQITSLYSTPHVALIPLLILWFGLGPAAKLVLIFLSAFFPIVI